MSGQTSRTIGGLAKTSEEMNTGIKGIQKEIAGLPKAIAEVICKEKPSSPAPTASSATAQASQPARVSSMNLPTATVISAVAEPIDRLIREVMDCDERVADRSRSELRRLGVEAAPRLVRIFSESGDDEVCKRVGRRLIDIGPSAVPACIKGFAVNSEKSRRYAWHVVKRIGEKCGGPAVLEALAIACDDTDSRVAVMARELYDQLCEKQQLATQPPKSDKEDAKPDP